MEYTRCRGMCRQYRLPAPHAAVRACACLSLSLRLPCLAPRGNDAACSMRAAGRRISRQCLSNRRGPQAGSARAPFCGLKKGMGVPPSKLA
jgi:hypothetical protein